MKWRGRGPAFVVCLAIVSSAGCGGDDESGSVEFRESAVRDAVDSSDLFDTPDEVEQAVGTFRRICETPATSINEFSVHDLVVNGSAYAEQFVATARLGCPQLFADVERMVADGACFGGALAGCGD